MNFNAKQEMIQFLVENRLRASSKHDSTRNSIWIVIPYHPSYYQAVRRALGVINNSRGMLRSFKNWSRSTAHVFKNAARDTSVFKVAKRLERYLCHNDLDNKSDWW